MKTVKLNRSFSVVGLAFVMSQSLVIHAQSIGDIRPLVGAIRIGKLGYAGSGCPQGSISAAVDQQSGRIVLRFEDFFAQAGGDRHIDRKSCSFAMPLSVPEGYSVRTLSYSLKGFAELPSGATARIQAENFFAGTRGTMIQKTLSTATDGEFNLRTPRSFGEWSECGEDVVLRTNMSITLQNASEESEAFVGIMEMRGVRSVYAVDVEMRACR